MRVILDSELFGPGIFHADLTRLLHFSVTGQHEILVDPGNASRVDQWLEQYDAGGDWRESLALAAQSAARPNSSFEVRVHAKPRSRLGESNPPLLSLRDACSFLAVPFSIYLENARRDTPVLQALCSPAQRREWMRLTAEGREWIKAENCGGITEMFEILAARVKPSAVRRMRSLFIFDSDAWSPGRLAVLPKALTKECKKLYIKYHILERRGPENYLPVPVFEHFWLRQCAPSQRESQSKKIQAFSGLNILQKSHFNMKAGFDGDRGDTGRPIKDRRLAEILFQGADRAALKDGFGKNVGDCFAAGAAQSHFEPVPEIVQLLDRILAAC